MLVEHRRGRPVCLPRLRRVGPGIAAIFQNRANIAFGGTSTWVCPYGYAKTVLQRQHDFFDFNRKTLPYPLGLA